ncbi:MAG: DNA-processing protein DprA [Bacteroidota bacterium]|nr:DNA-processing protein DprA [Bacteroidota bacterium]
MNHNELLYKIGVGLIHGLGPVNSKSLISGLGSAKAVFSASKSDLLGIPGIAEKGADKIIKHRNVLSEAEKELKFIEKHNIRTYFYADKDYPYYLKQCPDAPTILYSKGDLDLQNRNTLSIIGTRKATPYGKDLCRKLISELADRGHNPVIVSGLAYGIDSCAHQAALDSGLDTVAVLGHGLDRIYPMKHRNLAKQIVEQGALITEFMSNSEFKRQNFVQRNRIIAGITQATVIAESAKSGGSLITAELANSYSREVFAFPGRLGDAVSEGCNNLIKTHRAVLLQSADDIEYLLSWEKGKDEGRQKQLFVELSEDEEKIAGELNNGKLISTDELSRNTGMPTFKVSSILLELEFKGVVRTLPGKMYEISGNVNF